jgi:hypothetical protein
MRYVKTLYDLICQNCGKDFKNSYIITKTCSKECANERRAKISGRYVMREKSANISGGTVGAMSELMVSVDLMKKGYAVFRAMSPACFCDIIAVKENKTFKMEIRTGYMSGSNNLQFSKTLNGDIDGFGVYERNSGKIFYLLPNRLPLEI